MRLEGIVTYADRIFNSFYLQDETAGVHVRVARSQSVPEVGQVVRLQGVTQTFVRCSCVGEAKVEVVRNEVRPKPQQIALKEITIPGNSCQFVEVTGVLWRARLNPMNRFVLEIGDSLGSLQVFFSRPPQFESMFQDRIDSVVRIRGVVQPVGIPGDDRRSVLLMVDQPDDVVEVTPARDPQSIKNTPIRDLSRAVEHRVRIRGEARTDPGRTRLVVSDQSGVIEVVEPDGDFPRVKNGEIVEATGFIVKTEKTTQMVHPSLRVMVPDAPGSTTFRSLIHRCSDIRRLRRDELEGRPPVRLTATVTVVHGLGESAFVQDGGGSIYVCTAPNDRMLERLHPGDQVLFEGCAEPGGFAPVLRAKSAEVIGRSTLPRPAAIEQADLITGRLDCKFVEIEGTVHRHENGVCTGLLHVMTALGLITCRFESPDDLSPFVDRRVRIRGVYCALHRDDRPQVGFRVTVHSTAYVQFLDQGDAKPWSPEVRPIRRLSGYDPTTQTGGRSVIRGELIADFGRQWVYVQDESGGARIRLRETNRLPIGSRVEVSGYAGVVDGHFTLTESLIRTSTTEPATATVSEPKDLPGEQLSLSENYGRLVRIRGRVIDIPADQTPRRIRVLTESTAVDVYWVGTTFAEIDLKAVQVDSLVEVVGICENGVDGIRSGNGEVILPRSAADIVVIAAPPFWTMRRIQSTAAGIAGLLIVALIGIVAANRRIRRQTEVIREKLIRETDLEKRNQDLIENAGDMIFCLDSAGSITEWNLAAAKLTGFSRSEVIGKSLSIFLTDGTDKSTRSLITEHPTAVPLRLRTKEGRILTVEVTARAIQRNGVVNGTEAIARDMTDRYRLEEQMREVAKMQAIGQLAGGVAHDFNNLLTVINGNCDLVLNQLSDDDPTRGLIEEARTAGEQAGGVTRQLLAFGRRSVFNPRLVDLNELVRGLANVLNRLVGERIQLTYSTAADLRPVRVDSSGIEQVVLNLVVNARDAMPQGGLLTITTENANDKFVRLVVSDAGSGIGSDILPRIFEPYFTTKPLGSGTGLGLAVVQGVVDQCGGRIRVESRVGSGTRFTIEFPAADPTDSESDSRAISHSATVTEGHKVILLVEDEPSVMALEKRILESDHFEVLAASSGEEALEIVRNRRGGIDLLVTDVVMPGMNGRELADRIEKILPEIRVLFLSGYHEDEVLRQGIQTDQLNFLAKPFTPSALLKRVRQTIAGTVPSASRH